MAAPKSGFGGLRLSSESLKSLQICVAYGASSVMISLVYKALLSSYNYKGKFMLLAAQQGFSLLFCMFAKRFLAGRPGFEVPDVKRETFVDSLWPGFLNVANIVVGWYGMALVNIPLFLCVRRTATAMVLVTEYFIRGRVEDGPTQCAVGLIVGGAVIAGWETLASGDSLGLAYTMLNNVLTAWSHSQSKAFADKFNCHGFGIVLYNSLSALPLTLLGATVLGEWSYTAGFEHAAEPRFWASVALASCAGVFITYIVFLCTTWNGPLVTSITGNAKDIVQTVLGALLFRDFVPTVQNIAGILLSFCGAGLFSYIKLTAALAAGSKEASKKADSDGGNGAAAPSPPPAAPQRKVVHGEDVRAGEAAGDGGVEALELAEESAA